MTILATGSQTLTIAVPSGSSLVIKDLSGSHTVTGGSRREDASLSMGAGFSVYGPLGADGSLSISTTGVVDYQVVAGDPTPSTSGAAFVSAKAALIAAYEAQQARDVQNGPMLLARSGLPVAGDIPAITASATTPDADTDPATQLIYPFGDIGNIDPIPQATLEKKRWYRGHSVGLRARQTNTDFIRLAETCATYGSNGSQDQDSILGYGIDKAMVIFDAYLDGDVLFMRTQGNNGCTFSLFVNGSRVTAAPGSGITQVGSDRYHPTAKYVKLKWGSVARRRVQIVFNEVQCPTIFYTRAVGTLLPANTSPLTWLHFGDSFSQYTGATSRELGLTTWMHAAFGLGFDFVNVAQGGAGFVPGNRPGAAPTSAKPSTRNQYLLHANKHRASIATYLIGHNDADQDYTIAAAELAALLRQVAADNHGVIQCVFTTNASPGLITAGTATTVEAALIAAASTVPGVFVVPLQTSEIGAFLRGTGRVGSTTGVGNSDLYTGTDGTHPSDAGHRAYGQHMAAQFYAALLAS